MDTFSLFELNEHLRRVIALNFEDPLWVRCEISQVSLSRGHHYLELVEKDEASDDIRAQSSAVIWSKQFSFIKRKCGDSVHEVLRQGVEVRLKVRVDFNERYGLKLFIEDIDPTFTLGNLELKRRQVLEQLHRDRLIDRNGTLPIPAVVQRIAVLSSPTAAGYVDFLHQLDTNSYGYRFATELFSVSLQGQRVEQDVSQALEELARMPDRYDCAVIIRGGGSRLDLAGFDSLRIGQAIAACPIPVFTGIGHEIDQSVADVVAHTALKTPTAVADLIVEINLQFDATVADLYQLITQGARSRVLQSRNALQQTLERVRHIPDQTLASRRYSLDQLEAQLPRLARTWISQLDVKLENAGNLVTALDPGKVLKRGFSMTTKDGALVTDPATLMEHDLIETTFARGRTKSRVTHE